MSISDLSRVSLGLGTVKRAVSRKSAAEQELSRWDEERALLRSPDAQNSLSRPESRAELDSFATDSLNSQNGTFGYHRPSPSRSHADHAESSSASSPFAALQGSERSQGTQGAAPLLNIPTPFASVSDQGHAYAGSQPLSVLPDSGLPLPSIAEVDMTPRRSILETRSNSMPQSPDSARTAYALRESLGCTADTPLKSRSSGVRPFHDDSAKLFHPGPPPQQPFVWPNVKLTSCVCQVVSLFPGNPLCRLCLVAGWCPKTCCCMAGDSNGMGSAAALAMRHSRSLPSVPSADWTGLATPRNLIEVSARLRSSQEDLRRLGAQRGSEPLLRSGCAFCALTSSR